MTLEEIKKEINYYDNEINMIRDAVTQGDISLYKIILLNKKIDLIYQKIINITDQFKDIIKPNKIIKTYKNLSPLDYVCYRIFNFTYINIVYDIINSKDIN